MTFTTLVLAQIFNAFNARSDTVSAFVDLFANRLLWARARSPSSSRSPSCTCRALSRRSTPRRSTSLEWADLCVALASAVLWVDEVRKLLRRVRNGERSTA